jgi:regulator of RNase E activity RraB
MGLFDFFKLKQHAVGQFVTEKALGHNMSKQIQMVPETMEQLRKIIVSADQELKLEYFFYTNTIDKANRFASELEKLNYKVDHGQSAGDKKCFVITGWTTKMRMENDIVANWTKEMCELGYKFDCDFDGWGTSPDQ